MLVGNEKNVRGWKTVIRLIHVVVQCPQYVVLVLVAASLRPNSKRVFGPNPVFDMP